MPEPVEIMHVTLRGVQVLTVADGCDISPCCVQLRLRDYGTGAEIEMHLPEADVRTLVTRLLLHSARHNWLGVKIPCQCSVCDGRCGNTAEVHSPPLLPVCKRCLLECGPCPG
jgi:hypothetical protein